MIIFPELIRLLKSQNISASILLSIEFSLMELRNISIKPKRPELRISLG